MMSRQEHERRYMRNILILYASQTGMTADIAASLMKLLTERLNEDQFTLQDVRDTNVNELHQYKQVIIGASTWDHGIPAPDGEEFLSRLITARPDLSDSHFALFGLGDSAYPEFCGALPLIQADIERCQGKVWPEFFTIDGFADQQIMESLVNWSIEFLNSGN